MNRAHLHLKAALEQSFVRMGVSSPRIILEKPRDSAHGDIATNAALVHAKELKQNPRALAEELLKNLEVDRNFISSSSIAGPGFINFVLAPEYLQSIARQALQLGQSFGDSDDLAGTKILIEFVSANPTGPLNIVSARAAAVGDSLVRLFRSCGADCKSEFYVNDIGNQVRLLGLSVRARYETELGFPTEIPEGGYHGQYLLDYAIELAKEYGKQFHELPEDEAAVKLGSMAINRHVKMHQDVLESFRVQFDRWFHESELRNQKRELAALEELRARGVVYEKDGATFVRTSDYGDGQDWVVVTSDKRPTYFLPDIAYHLDKYARGFENIIDILGPDHHSFTSKMKAALKALGRDAEQLEVILLQHVTLLRDGELVKMSKRAGQLIEMQELLEEVGTDSARYFFLLRRTSTPLDFDIELAKRKTDDNPVFYVQYAHARIESIFKKAQQPYPTAETDMSLLQMPEELDLLRRLRELREVIIDLSSVRDPHGMTSWLREVATQFHKFYHNCRVLTEPIELQNARLALCRATQIGLQKGLALCGVSAPKEM